jgi:hypothetical protein
VRPFDYGAAVWQLVARVLNENSLRLSRTRKGVSDTSTSAAKLPLRLAGDELRRRSEENERRTHRFLFESRDDAAPAGGAEVAKLLWAVADLTNDGLLPAGKLRTWPIAGATGVKVPPDDLPGALASFCDAVHRRWPELAADPVPLATWAEWELNGGSLHPFYDGCGRISRSFAALLLVQGRCLLPLYDDLTSYFEHGNRGLETFVAYVRDRIEECASWLGQGRPPGT